MKLCQWFALDVGGELMDSSLGRPLSVFQLGSTLPFRIARVQGPQPNVERIRMVIVNMSPLSQTGYQPSMNFCCADISYVLVPGHPNTSGASLSGTNKGRTYSGCVGVRVYFQITCACLWIYALAVLARGMKNDIQGLFVKQESLFIRYLLTCNFDLKRTEGLISWSICDDIVHGMGTYIVYSTYLVLHHWSWGYSSINIILQITKCLFIEIIPGASRRFYQQAAISWLPRTERRWATTVYRVP